MFVQDVADFAAAVRANESDRKGHEHPTDICECGPYRWPCPSCGAVQSSDGERLASWLAYAPDGRCQTCIEGGTN